MERFVRISQEYGDRLRTSNVRKGTIEKLLGSYPSHEFVIDREEAGDLFERIEFPGDELEVLAAMIIQDHHPTADSMDSYIAYINDELTEEPSTAETKHEGISKNTPSARPANQIQRISLNLTTGSGCDVAIGFL